MSRSDTTRRRPATPGPSAAAPGDAPGLARLLRGGDVHSVLQPVVDLRSGAVVAHEALLRGPAGTDLASPLALLEAAQRAGLLPALETASVAAALRAARTGPGAPTLFVNVEPSTLTQHPDAVLAALADRGRTQVVVEITERALADDPAGVLRAAGRLRAAGCALALDDVGAEPASLALLPVLAPEVVKLDLSLLRTLHDVATVTVAGAVRSYAERSGADVVAEGVETADDLLRAQVLGATLAQGWWWGRPGPEPLASVAQPERFAPRPLPPTGGATPFELVEALRPVSRLPKRLLLPISTTLELGALSSRVPPIVLATFQHERFYGPGTAARYAGLAAGLPLVAGFATGLAAQPSPGVRGTALAPGDPLVDEWVVVVLGAHDAAALVGRDTAPADARRRGGDRDFDVVVTHDRDLVTLVARALLGRVAPAPTSDVGPAAVRPPRPVVVPGPRPGLAPRAARVPG